MISKILILTLLLTCTLCSYNPRGRLPGQKILLTYVDRLSSYWGGEKVADAIAMPGYSPLTEYNVVNLAFLLNYGAADAAAIWANPFGFMEYNNNPFGSDKAKVQQIWLDNYRRAGKKIMVSAFGSTQHPTSQGFDAKSTCGAMAQFVKDNYLDGIDLDYEDNEAMNRGEAPAWLIECTKAIREIIPASEGYLLTHAPQAPYFVGNKVYPNGAYQDVNNAVGHLIDWYNVQFYNQGDTEYNTYELLFIDAKYGSWNGSAVKQLMDYGVPKDKIVIGKPATPRDAYNTGYVEWSDLHDWAAKAAVEPGLEWDTGVFSWQYSNDKYGEHIYEYLYGKE